MKYLKLCSTMFLNSQIHFLDIGNDKIEANHYHTHWCQNANRTNASITYFCLDTDEFLKTKGKSTWEDTPKETTKGQNWGRKNPLKKPQNFLKS
jgi:hypothetical protein